MAMTLKTSIMFFLLTLLGLSLLFLDILFLKTPSVIIGILGTIMVGISVFGSVLCSTKK